METNETQKTEVSLIARFWCMVLIVVLGIVIAFMVNKEGTSQAIIWTSIAIAVLLPVQTFFLLLALILDELREINQKLKG